MRHKIAIVSKLRRSGIKILNEIANNNKYHFFSRGRGELHLLDGTIIKVATSKQDIFGARYTQIIIDKYSLNMFDNINDIIYYITSNSPIPSEFIVIEVW